MNTECIFHLPKSKQSIENYTRIAEVIENIGGEISPRCISKMTKNSRYFKKDELILFASGKNWYMEDEISTDDGELTATPYTMDKVGDSIQFEDIVSFTDEDLKKMRENKKTDTTPVHAYKYGKSRKDIFDIIGTGIVELNDMHIPRYYDTDVAFCYWGSPARDEVTYDICFKTIETETEYQLWVCACTRSDDEKKISIPKTEIRAFSESKNTISYQEFIDKVESRAGYEIDRFMLILEQMEKEHAMDFYDNPSGYSIRQGVYCGTFKQLKEIKTEHDYRRFMVPGRFDELILEAWPYNEDSKAMEIVLGNENFCTYQDGSYGKSLSECVRQIDQDECNFYYDLEYYDRALESCPKVNGYLRYFESVHKDEAMTAYMSNANEEEHDYYFVIYDYISQNININIWMAKNLIFLDGGELIEILRVKNTSVFDSNKRRIILYKGSLIVHLRANGMHRYYNEKDDLKLIDNYGKWESTQAYDFDRFNSDYEIIELNPDKLNLDLLERVPELSSIFDKEFLFDSYGDGTCSVFYAGNRDQRKGIAIPQLSPNAETVVDIEPFAFYRAKIASINIPDSVDSIEMGALEYCECLREIKYDGKPQYVSGHAFDWCLIGLSENGSKIRTHGDKDAWIRSDLDWWSNKTFDELFPDPDDIDTGEVIEALDENPHILIQAPEDLLDNRDFITQAVKASVWALKYIPEKHLRDREMMLSAIAHDSMAIEYASEELMNDLDFIIEAIQLDYGCYKYASKAQKSDERILKVLLNAIVSYPYSGDGILEHVPQNMRNDRELVLASVKMDGLDLEFAPESLREDREIVIEAVKNRGTAFKYASESLQRDPEIALLAIKKDAREFTYVSEELKGNYDFIHKALDENPKVFHYLPEEYKHD